MQSTDVVSHELFKDEFQMSKNPESSIILISTWNLFYDHIIWTPDINLQVHILKALDTRSHDAPGQKKYKVGLN